MRLKPAIMVSIVFALFTGFMVPPRLIAAPINSIQAKYAAETFLTVRFPALDPSTALTVTPTGASWLAVTKVTPYLHNDIIVGFITTLEPSGYVLLRADDEVPPVKIYTESGAFDRLPPGFLKVIKLELAEELQNLTALKQSGAPIDNEFQEEWSSLLNPGAPQAATNLPTSAPGVVLLATTWNQGVPYNHYCPTASGGPGGRAYAGCTACALSQILRYHGAPTQVSQNHTYTDNSGSCTGSHSISDAGMDAYDWENMPTSITTSSPLSEQQAIGQLMYHAAVALESDFEANGTGAYPSDIPSVLRTYFGYTSGSYEGKSSFTSSQWYSKISTDIDASQPVFYSMWQADYSAGHAVVCDGYRNGDEIHINMGWSGSGNLWYDIDTITYGGYTWTRHGAVFDIRPLGGTLPAPILTGEPSVTPGTENTIYWSAVSAMDVSPLAAEPQLTSQVIATSIPLMTPLVRFPDTVQDVITTLASTPQTIADAFDRRVSEPAQATLPLDSVFVPDIEEEKVISDSELLSAATIFRETFEGVFPGASWTLYGSPTWDDTSYNAHGGYWSGWCGDSSINPANGYVDDMKAWMVYGPFSLADATRASVNFWYRNLSESGYDYFKWMASVNGTNFYGWQVSGDQNTWRSQEFDLTDVYTLGDLSGQSQVWIAFLFTSDDSVSGPTYTGAYVDDIVITKDTSIPTADLTVYKPSNWNDKIPIGISQLAWNANHNYTGPYKENQTLYFNWGCLNQGNATASGYTVHLEVTGTGGGSWNWTNITTAPNYWTHLTADQAVGPLSEGSHTFKVWVDYYDTVNESTKTNNYYERSINVSTDVTTEYYAECASNSSFTSAISSAWITQRQYTFRNLTSGQTYWYRVKAKSGTTESDWSNVEHSQQEDILPPTPDPMTWANQPNPASSTSMAMVATTATDSGSPPVWYYFDFVDSPTGGSGGSDSSWQSSASYTDTGLQANHRYGYRAKARDSCATPNETAYSSTVYTYTLANPPGAAAFSNVTQNSIRANWVANGNPGGTQYYCENTTQGTNSGWTTNTYWISSGLGLATSYCFKVKSRNGDGVETTWTTLGCQSTDGGDSTPPTPDPMTWANQPNPASSTSMAMVATTATDSGSPPVWYYFDFVDSPTGGSGGSDSSWQSSASYTDTGLQANHRYGYRAKARDSCATPNETAYSSTVYTYTLANPPGAAAFSNVTQNSIRVNWVANGNPGGTQYYCENTTQGTNSGWTTDTSWNCTGLVCEKSYAFRVKAKNEEGIETEWINLGLQDTMLCVNDATILPAIYQMLLFR